MKSFSYGACVLFFAFWSGPVLGAEYSTIIDTSVVRDVRGGATFTFQIHAGLAPCTFKLVPDPKTNTITRIEVYNAGPKTPSQVLEAGQGEAPYRDSDYFRSVDVDFDGYQDIGLLSWWGATGNEGWTFWRYDPSSRKFVLAPEVSALGRPEFDARTQTIHSSGKGGWCDFSTESYHYVQHKLVRFEGKRCLPPPGGKPGESECACKPF